MKIRHGFVSNSSTSSFVCGVCGGVESGMDASPDEFDMVECENGHCWHVNCCKTEDDVVGLAKWNAEKDRDEYEDYGSGYVPSTICPFCMLKKIDVSEKVSYFCLTTGMTDDQIIEDIKSRFGDYSGFVDAVKKEKEKGEKNESA